MVAGQLTSAVGRQKFRAKVFRQQDPVRLVLEHRSVRTFSTAVRCRVRRSPAARSLVLASCRGRLLRCASRPASLSNVLQMAKAPRNLCFCVPLKAKPDKEKEVADFRRSAVPTPNRDGFAIQERFTETSPQVPETSLHALRQTETAIHLVVPAPRDCICRAVAPENKSKFHRSRQRRKLDPGELDAGPSSSLAW